VPAWEVSTGRPLADLPEAPAWAGGGHSRDGHHLARADGEVIYLHDLHQAPDADEAAFREAMARLDPLWQHGQALQAERAGQWLAVAFHLDRSLEAWPDDTGLYLRRGRARAELGRWAEARADFGEAVRRAPDDPAGWRGLALTHLAEGRPDDYRQTCGLMLRHFGPAPQAVVVGLLFGPAADVPLPAAAAALLTAPDLAPPPPTARALTARTCALRADGAADPAGLLSLAGANDPLTRGAVLCRAGRPAEAVQALRASQDAAGLLYRALAEQQRGRGAEARKDHEQAVQWLATPSKNDPKQPNAARLSWDQRLEVDLLRKEVEALLAP
jgi:tetratricopeptide (TPR) repeat protein